MKSAASRTLTIAFWTGAAVIAVFVVAGVTAPQSSPRDRVQRIAASCEASFTNKWEADNCKLEAMAKILRDQRQMAIDKAARQ